jgi:hypothetical protein
MEKESGMSYALKNVSLMQWTFDSHSIGTAYGQNAWRILIALISKTYHSSMACALRNTNLCIFLKINQVFYL